MSPTVATAGAIFLILASSAAFVFASGWGAYCAGRGWNHRLPAAAALGLLGVVGCWVGAFSIPVCALDPAVSC